MKVPYTLRRRANAAPATALLLPSRQAAELFELVARLRLDPFPPVYATADGFLIKLPTSLSSAVAGVVRLRSLSEHLFLPVDAELLPPLLADEAEGLVSARGLVFLPGNRILEFAPAAPLAWSALLRIPTPSAPAWQALPTPAVLANELLEVASTVPPSGPDAILELGRDDIATESPRPEKGAGLGSKIAGAAMYAIGKSLAVLGTGLGLRGLASAGAGLLERALKSVPRLSERLMSAQEAMLRSLLKDFRDGKLEQALRRALPLGGQAQGGVVATDAVLPAHSLMHSLQNLLGQRQGPGSVWFTPDDLYLSLRQEYHRQAEAAAQRGDYRRAAFIYAKLLNDMAGAARILSQGGLHRDSAVIYEKALNDLRAAAAQWEAAGEIDRAVEILVQLREYVGAGEVLRKVGETERALHWFRQAAARLAGEKKFYEAGELLRSKAQRPDLALEMFRAGWEERPRATALPCGLFLAEHLAHQPNAPRFLQLLTQAEQCLTAWDAHTTVHFFNEMARLAHQPSLANIADETVDRCLLALAGKMTQPNLDVSRARVASVMFPANSPWPAPVARDAQEALKNRDRRPTISFAEPACVTRLGRSTVRAVCHMPLSGELFLGFENGEVLRYRLSTGEAWTVARRGGPIHGLLADAEEQHLVVISYTQAKFADVLVGSRSVEFRLEMFLRIESSYAPRLCATVANHPSPFFGVIAGEELFLFRADNLSLRKTILLGKERIPTAGVVGTMPNKVNAPWVFLFHEYGGLLMLEHSVVGAVDLEAGPGQPARSTLYQTPVQAWLLSQYSVNLHWATRDASLYSLNLVLDTLAVPQKAERILTAKPVLGIHGSVDHRVMHAIRGTLWDQLNDQWLARGQVVNPVAMFIHADGQAVVVEASGTITRAPIVKS